MGLNTFLWEESWVGHKMEVRILGTRRWTRWWIYSSPFFGSVVPELYALLLQWNIAEMGFGLRGH
jgi:hypothetical protein